nr:hypothetical protein [Tanacetum cinerariifolium]
GLERLCEEIENKEILKELDDEIQEDSRRKRKKTILITLWKTKRGSLILAILFSWFLVYDVSEALKDMIEHETHFIPNLMDEGLDALRIRTKWFWLSTKSITSPIEVGWWKGRKEGFVLHVIGRLISDCLNVRGGGFKLLGGKSSREFKNRSKDLARTCWSKSKTRVVLRVVGMKLFPWSGDDSLDDMSLMLVLATFLSGFLVEEEALEAIFGCEQ